MSRHFVEACGHGLGINERLIKEDQQEYHDEMKANYRDLARELSIIMREQVSVIFLRFVCTKVTIKCNLLLFDSVVANTPFYDSVLCFFFRADISRLDGNARSTVLL